jgi:hypothetical protein
MSTTVPTKTDSVEIIAHQAAVHPTTISSSIINVATKRRVSLFLYHAYVEATADTNPGRFVVEVRPDDGASSTNENWVIKWQGRAKGTTPDTEAMTATEPVGETSLAVASTTGFAIEDLLYIQDTGTLADSEWGICKKFVANTNIQLLHGLTNQKDAADVIWNDASAWNIELDLDAHESFQVHWQHEGTTGANGHIKVLAIYQDSETTT